MNSLRSFKLLLLVVLMIFGTACAKQEEKQSISVGKLYPLVVHTDQGAVLLQVELARTTEELRKGLMYRKSLAQGTGMLFVFEKPHEAVFWMKNTLIPLDMIFIRENGKIEHIHENAEPLDETPIGAPADDIKAILEIGGGEASRQGIKIGHRIDTKIFQSEPTK